MNYLPAYGKFSRLLNFESIRDRRRLLTSAYCVLPSATIALVKRLKGKWNKEKNIKLSGCFQ